MLEWKNVSFTYAQGGANNILNGVNLEILPGRVTVLTGASGCGKSTMLYLAAGLYPKNAGLLRDGYVSVGGQNIADIPPEKRALVVGMMFQNPDLQFCMDTVKNELVFCLENVSVPPAEMDAIIDDALNFCGIAHLKERKLITLSGGEKQKAMLSCIVALNPGWILLDEPFANIDPDAAREIAERLAKLRETRGTGIVAVDHHLGIWTEIADEIVVMEKGGVIAMRDISPKNLPEAALLEYGVSVPGLPYQSAKPLKIPEGRQPVLRFMDMGVMQGGETILKNCSASFYKGRIHAITGKSGSGKSTLFDALCRLVPYTGSIITGGQEIKKIPRRRIGEKIGFVFQNPNDQFIAGNVLDEIIISLKNRLPAEEAYARAELILRGLKLWRYRKVSPYMLSQGQQRRLGVAALLENGCDILVCDEPTYAQDRRSLLAIMNSLQERVIENGLTLIFSTHDQRLARDYADIVYELKEGAIYERD